MSNDLLGDAIEELLETDAGPYEFQGKEDYIRGETNVIRGESACLRGLAVVGIAMPQRGSRMAARGRVAAQGAGFKEVSLPGGKKFLTLRVKSLSSLRSSHRDSVQQARTIAKHARMVANSLRNYSSPKGKGGRRVVGDEYQDMQQMADVDELMGQFQLDSIEAVQGLGDCFDDVLGVVALRQHLKRRQPLPSDAEVRRLAAELDKVAQKLSGNADAHEKRTNDSLGKLAQGVAASRRAYGPGGTKGVAVVGGGAAVSLPFDTTSFELMGADPDPSNPGYLADGSPDPAYAPPGQGGAATGELPPGPPDYGVGPAPTADSDAVKMVAGIDFDPDPSGSGASWMTNWDSKGDPNNLPKGAILYDKTLPFPISGVGSKTRFFGGAPDDKGGGDSGFEWGNQTDQGHSDGWYWFQANGYYDKVAIDFRYTHDDASNWGGATGMKSTTQPPPILPYAKNTQFDPGKDPGRARAEASMAMGWGPLIGNPNQRSPGDAGMAQRDVPLWVWGLKYDIGLDAWFWYWDAAPDWARAPYLAARLNKAVLDYQGQVAAAKTEYLQAVAQAKADALAAAQQAKDWQKQQTQMQQDQQKFDQQQAQQQAQLDLDQQKQAAQSDAQGQQLDFQRQQLEMTQQAAEEKAYEQFLQQGGGQQMPPGGGYDDTPFDDLAQPDGAQDDGTFAESSLDKDEAEMDARGARPDLDWND